MATLIFTTKPPPALRLTGTRHLTEDSIRSPAPDIARLTRDLAAHDEKAFCEFHERYFARLYQFLLILARGDEHEAREVLQETLLRVARGARKFTDEETFWCWLKTVARNTARDGGRKRRRYFALLEHFARRRLAGDQGEVANEEERLSPMLAESLDELPAEDRRLLEEKYLEGAAIRELAVRAGLTKKAVESRLGRLRRQLRVRLLEKMNEP